MLAESIVHGGRGENLRTGRLDRSAGLKKPNGNVSAKGAHFRTGSWRRSPLRPAAFQSVVRHCSLSRGFSAFRLPNVGHWAPSGQFAVETNKVIFSCGKTSLKLIMRPIFGHPNILRAGIWCATALPIFSLYFSQNLKETFCEFGSLACQARLESFRVPRVLCELRLSRGVHFLEGNFL